MLKRRSKKKVYIGIILLLLVVGTIVYRLADRYLIEHIEVIVSTSPTSQTPATVTSTDVQYDDSNYTSSDTAIHIKKVQTGSGADTITYFVADVILKESASVQSAFAKSAFGSNIIQNTSRIAADNSAILAINGDYYGFRKDGVIIRNGVLYRDDPTRTALALLQNGTLESFDENSLTSASLLAEGVTNTLSFGPVLVKNGEVIDDFENVSIDTNLGNRSIQGLNPRTGIGMIAPNHFLFIVVDGRMKNYSKGMTLSEFAQVFADLGATEAYNLDGGGSSTMYFMGKVVNNPLGKGNERGVSDILYVAE
ncbi:MAG: phosphodiester glycosidase family protein [Gorillibacterium sp.]|nr:phosphodiester glycosidase family protein [Gorillibacterium sp.]